MSYFLALSLSASLAASSANLPVIFCKSLNVDNSSAMSSAKSRSSSIALKFYLIPLLLSSVAFLMSQSKHSKNRNPEIAHPCCTPVLIINQSDVSFLSTTAHSKPTYMPAICHSYHPVWYPITSHDIPLAFSVYIVKDFFSLQGGHTDPLSTHLRAQDVL